MNIAKLNTASLDDKTFIIKRGTSGGTTINNQDKVVDITENGTTEVVADGGFTGLGKVTINTEVSGGESGGSTFEYLDITNVTGLGGQLKMLLLQMAYMCKVPNTVKIQMPDVEGYVTISQSVGPASGWAASAGRFVVGTEEFRLAMDAVSAMSINFSDTINMQGQVLTIGEVFAMYGVQAEIDTIPRLTKEQFYNLD